MRIRDLLHRLNDAPFKGFRIHLSDGSSIPVVQPGMVIVGRSCAILPVKFGKADGELVVDRSRTVDFAQMVKFGDLDGRASDKKRKRKR